MDISKQPGITFVDVILKKVSFSRESKIPQNPKLDISFEQQNNITEDQKKLIMELTCNISEKSNSFNIQTTMIGFFSVIEDNENMSLKDFAKINAPALLFPYIRELIASITTKSGITPIILPPCNINAMIKNNT